MMDARSSRLTINGWCFAEKKLDSKPPPMSKHRTLAPFVVLLAAAAGLPLAHGCSDGSVECLGSAVSCDNRDLSECTEGCRVREGCVGTTVDCASLTDEPSLCVQTAGCRYLGSCDGVEGCEDVGYDECADTPGCVQVRRCGGSGVRCSALEDSLCELYPQCTRGSECTGSATACADLDSTSACYSVPGCVPADTTPSVVE